MRDMADTRHIVGLEQLVITAMLIRESINPMGAINTELYKLYHTIIIIF